MDKIKFGTDGWRSIIAGNFTVGNVARLTNAVAIWLLNKYRETSVVIGYDTRFGGKMFAETAARVLALKGIKVFLAKDYVTSPVVSYAITWYGSGLGIMITAGNYTCEYNGYKLKGDYGGPLVEENIKNIEDLLTDDLELDLNRIKWQNLIEQKLIEYADLTAIYTERIKSYFDLDAIKKSGFRFAFDAMYGSGQVIMHRILTGLKNLHCRVDPLFDFTIPDPTENNLAELINSIKSSGNIDCGLAVDSDAEHLALIDKNGNYIGSNHILLVLIHYFAGYRKMKGKVIASYSSTSAVEKICKHYGLGVQRIKSDFKEICRSMLKEDILIGGEESGGIAVRNHIPDRDGIWNGLLIWQFMAETGKSMEQLISEVYSITGKFACEGKDIEVSKEHHTRVLDYCRNDKFTSFGHFRVIRSEQYDGYKFFFREDKWVLIKPSLTEPKIMIRAESETKEQALSILDAVCDIIQNF